MTTAFDFIVVGGGSAGAVIASRLSENPDVTVALVEAGGRPPARELMPAACASLQLDPEADWMYMADPGKAGLGMKNRQMRTPRGKMLGGSSGINYMVWVRGHPDDYANWEKQGAAGWGYEHVLPAFKRMEDLSPSNEIDIDRDAHGVGGPIGVSVRSPMIPANRQFVQASEASGIPRGDYNGKDRLNPAGVASLHQTNTRKGKRSSTYHAYLAGEPETRKNLTIITGAQVTRVLLDGEGEALTATGIAYSDEAGTSHTISARKEVILSAGAIGSPHLLMLSGIGPRRELEAVGVICRHDLQGVGKHLKDHLFCVMTFDAPGVGVSLGEIGLSMGPDVLRAPAGPLPEDPADDVHLTGALADLKAEADRRLDEWVQTGSSLIASSFNDASAFFSSGVGPNYSHDVQISFMPGGVNIDLWHNQLNADPYAAMPDPEKTYGVDSEFVVMIPQLALPKSEGEIVLASSDATVHPRINMNYYADKTDLDVMVAGMRKSLEIAANWPSPNKLGPWLAPPQLALAHGHVQGGVPSDAMLENTALHFSTTVYHVSCTCRIGTVVDPKLKVYGVNNLRIADASVMPDITSGNINAVVIMIGERAAEMIAADHM